MRLTPKQQHDQNAARILGKPYKMPVEENQHAKQAQDILDKKPPQEAPSETFDTLIKFKKDELQEICTTREIDFTDDETKKDLISKILGQNNDNTSTTTEK